MRKLILAAVTVLTLAAAEPAFPQGVQLPSAPNATPPTGTLPDGRTSTVKRRRPVRHPRPVHRRTRSEQQAPAVQTPWIG